MPITHIVQFQFKATVDPAIIKETCAHMLSLKDKCVLPTTGNTYIKYATGGKENSPEGLQGGITHLFVMEFENESDREFYLKSDPAHLAFVKGLDGLVEKVRVVDFSNGVY